MNCVVIYGTMTKHCKKLATAIAGEINANIVNVKTDTPDLLYCDVAIIVTGIYGGEVLSEMKKYINSLNNTQLSKAIIIYSSVKHDYSKIDIKEVLKNKGIEVVSENSSTGSFIFKNFGRPNRYDVDLAVDFVKDELAKINL
ncbi:MAG: hypothetical protein GX896_01020 [Clostridiales bacterium]|nr:hypothetical protein [Clostridiales bacterium]